MRKIVSTLFITLDGITEEPGNWQETFDEDMAADMGESMTDVDGLLLGRKTYQYWASYWPSIGDDHPDAGYANFINHNPKYVVSSTLDKVEWGSFANATLIKGNMAEAITKLKQQPGKTISVQGSPTLVNSLLQAGLLDELKLVIHNVVVYEGARLFKEGSLKRLNLTQSKITRSGVAILTYQPR